MFVILAMIAAFVFRNPILAFLLEPGFSQLDEQPIATEVLETVGVTFKVTLLVAFAASLPVILYHVIMFASPGLTTRERLYLFLFLPGVLAAFGAGVAFGYYVLFPPAFYFLFNFGSENVNPEIRIASYVNVITSLMFWMGVVFQIPLVLFALGRLGVVSSRWLLRRWRFAVLLAFIGSRDDHADVRPGEPDARGRAHHRPLPVRHPAGAAGRASAARRAGEGRARPRPAAAHRAAARVLAAARPRLAQAVPARSRRAVAWEAPERLAGALPFYYGWVVVGVGAAAVTSRVVGSVEAASVFVAALTAEYGWSATLLAVPTLIGSSGSALGGPFVGRVLDRRGPRLVTAAGTALVGVSCFALAATQSILFYIAFYGLLRMAGQGMVQLSSQITAAKWFERRRGRAIALVTLISSVGLVGAPPVAQALIDGPGIAVAWMFFGCLALGIGTVPSLLLLARSPEGPRSPAGRRSACERAGAAAELHRGPGGPHARALGHRLRRVHGLVGDDRRRFPPARLLHRARHRPHRRRVRS